MEAIRELAEASRAEEGVLEYRVATDIEDKTLVRVIERYESEAAFGAHAESDHLERFEAALPEYLAGGRQSRASTSTPQPTSNSEPSSVPSSLGGRSGFQSLHRSGEHPR